MTLYRHKDNKVIELIMARHHYTDKDYEDALRGIMLSFNYQHRCCGAECRINATCDKCGRINEKVSEDKIEEQLFDMYHIGKIHEQDRYNKKIAAARRKSGTNNELLLTIVFDQDIEPLEAIKNQWKVIEAMECANYKWFVDKEVIYSFEYYTKDSEKFKPHIHIAFEKSAAPSTIQQCFYNKFVKNKKHSVYGVNCVVRPNKVACDYVKGLKKQDKQESCEKDNIFRAKYNLKRFYQFNT